MMHIAIKAASLSTFRQKVGAAVIKGGNVYSVACNAIRHKKGKFMKNFPCSLHAEQAAILQLPDEVLKGAVLYVARITKNGYGNAFPCYLCRDLIIRKGIKKVYYTNEYGEESIWQVR